MSKRFENGYVALVVTCIVCLLWIAIVAWTVPYSKGYQRADQDHQSAYRSDQAAREIREECARAASVREAIACYDKNVTNDRDYQRAEQNLDAQREIANWAEGMLWVTAIFGCLTVGVTGIGVYWVKETLAATREAVRAADDAVTVTRSIGEAQVRAHLMPETARARLITSQNGDIVDGYYKIDLEILNVGNTPAYRIGTKSRINDYPKDGVEYYATPRDIGPNKNCTFSIDCRISAEIFGEVSDDCVVGVYIYFHTIFTRGKQSNTRERIRFDYRISKSQNGGHKMTRL